MSFRYNISYEFNGFFPSIRVAFLLGPGRGECFIAGAVGRPI